MIFSSNSFLATFSSTAEILSPCVSLIKGTSEIKISLLAERFIANSVAMVSALTFNTSDVFLSKTKLGIIIISCSLNKFLICKASTETTSPT